ncbi:MAG: topoisomerase C-terminal repeat-containing protein [Betaproteobacteria bacterium]
MDTINFEQAIELFKLPRKLGQTEKGEEIITNVGRFGPYVKYGAKYVSLKIDDPYTIELSRALDVIKEKEIADANRLILDFPDAGIQVLNGRYGPYITDKARNAKIPKDRDPKSLTLPECQAMLAAAPARTFGKWGKKGAKNSGGAAGKKSKAAAAVSAAAPIAAAAKATPKPGSKAAPKQQPAPKTQPKAAKSAPAAKKKAAAKKSIAKK